MIVRRFRAWLLLALAWSALAPAAAFGQAAAQASEASLKAALVYKFASYVEWPAAAFGSPESPLVFGVLGADDVAAELEQLARARKLNDRPLAVRRLGEADKLAGVHVLFVGRRESARVPALSRAAQPLSVLLISDSERGLENGSVINFVPVEDRLGFEVSLDAAERSNLRISSRMLAVARRVLARSG